MVTPAAGQCPGSGECCIPNGTPGCNDNACCLAVCAGDPFCCDVQWDFNCAVSAAGQCGVCNAGCPGTGNCCSENATPGCGDPFCCGLVCTANPFCCEFGWDALCAQEAGVLCAICIPPPLCPGGGDCCVPNGSPSCDDAACCALVCAFDEFCCLSLWDNICAASAADLCAACVQGDLTGDGIVGVSDFLLLLEAWGPCSLCAACAADLDGDCVVGINDMLLLLANWG